MINLFDLWVQHGTPGLHEDSDSFDETIEEFRKLIEKVRCFFTSHPDVENPKLSVVKEKILNNTLTEEQAHLMLSRMKLFNSKIERVRTVEIKPIPAPALQPNIVDVLTDKAKGITNGEKYFTTRTKEIQDRAEQIIGRSVPITIHEIVKKSKASPELTDDELSTVIDMMEDCPGLMFKPRQRVSYTVKKRLI